MPHPRKFRFGVQLHSAASRKDWVNQVRKAEDLGYSSIFLPDHFGDQLSPIVALASAAELTELRIGTLVLDNDYKHPVVLAKEAASLDLLSEGRLELGVGAGWMRSDYEQSGIPYDRPGVRIDRFEEGLKVVKGAFADGPFSFAGKHYTITDYDGKPKPAQKPHPPFLIGGGGKRILRIAGREADIVGINFNARAGEVNAEVARTGSAEATDDKIAWVREGAGDRFDDLELNILVAVSMVADDRRATAEQVGSMFGLSADEVIASPHALVGSVDEICEELEGHRERYGISYVVFGDASAEPMAPVVERLAGR